LEFHFIDNKKEEGQFFDIDSRSALAFELKKLNLKKDFELGLTKEAISLIILSGNFGYQGVFFELKNGKEFRKLIKVKDELDLIDISLNFYSSKASDEFLEFLKERERLNEKEARKRYLKWKEGFDQQKISEKNTTKKVIVISVMLTILILWFLYYVISGDFKYSGDTIIYKKGRVVHTHQSSTSFGNYQFQTVEYEVDNKEYRKNFREFGSSNFVQKGDLIFLEIDSLKPINCRRFWLEVDKN